MDTIKITMNMYVKCSRNHGISEQSYSHAQSIFSTIFLRSPSNQPVSLPQKALRKSLFGLQISGAFWISLTCLGLPKFPPDGSFCFRKRLQETFFSFLLNLPEHRSFHLQLVSVSNHPELNLFFETTIAELHYLLQFNNIYWSLLQTNHCGFQKPSIKKNLVCLHNFEKEGKLHVAKWSTK